MQWVMVYESQHAVIMTYCPWLRKMSASLMSFHFSVKRKKKKHYPVIAMADRLKNPLVNKELSSSAPARAQMNCATCSRHCLAGCQLWHPVLEAHTAPACWGSTARPRTCLTRDCCSLKACLVRRGSGSSLLFYVKGNCLLAWLRALFLKVCSACMVEVMTLWHRTLIIDQGTLPSNILDLFWGRNQLEKHDFAHRLVPHY